MKIAVVAANGRSGKEFVLAALKNGHEVHAGVYRNYQFDENPRLEIVQCDATDPKQIQNLLNGCDAVVSFIGHGRKSPASVQTDAISNVINAAEETGIKRVVSLTGTGVRFPGDNITLMDRILNFSIGTIDPKRVNDGKKHVEILKRSDLGWTIIRVLKLTNGKPKPFTLNQNGPTKLFTPRSEVALACLEVLQNNSFIKQAPIISKGS